MKEPYLIDCVVVKRRGKKIIVQGDKKIATLIFRPNLAKKIIRYWGLEEWDRIKVEISPGKQYAHSGMLLF